MRSILSPAESLGLAGTALEARITRATHHIADATFSRIARRLLSDAFANNMIYEHNGEAEAIRIMLRPLLAMPEQHSYVHHVCLRLTDCLKRLAGLYQTDSRIQRILALTAAEDKWLEATWTEAHQRLCPVYGRLDAVCDYTSAAWQDSLKFMEANLNGVGGIHYSPLAERLLMKDVVPTLLAHDPELSLELPRDQRDLFVQSLMDHARAIGRPSCNLCFIEPVHVHDGPDEQSVLSRYLADKHGLSICHADPSELRVVGDEVYFNDLRIDVAYRDYELRDLIALEKELGRPLDAMRLLFRQNRIISSLAAEFDHKSCLEILTDPSIAEGIFSMDECRLFRRHVLWTRLVGPRRTLLPHHIEGDLLEYVRTHREQLVLKPNRGYGGVGVVIGAASSASEWERLLDEAASRIDDPEQSWVVQEATRLPVAEFPIVSEQGRVFTEPFYVVMGFGATENGLATLCRVSQKQVVNVAQRGGLAAVLVAHAPHELQIPQRPVKRSTSAAQALRTQISDLYRLDHAIALLAWDEETMLPEGGHAERGEQLATLEGMRHKLMVSDGLGDLMEEVEAGFHDDARWRRELELLRHLRRHAQALPEDLVRHFANAKSQALAAWEAARRDNDFTVFARPLETIVELLRERAQALHVGEDLYDSLIDEYEPGMTRARLDPVIGELTERLPGIVASRADQGLAPSPLGAFSFDIAAQWKLGLHVLKAIGFDFARGRLDRSTHPFTLYAGMHDVRLTVHPREDDFVATILALLHEGGHALYDQGLAEENRDWLLCEPPSTGMHECQARLWETHVGLSRAFWRYVTPTLRELFPHARAALDEQVLFERVNRIQASPVRLRADKLSYHLHIALRYELEARLLGGELKIRDLREAWRQRSKQLIGIQPNSDVEGVLQDVHWANGMFGYFPCYTIGDLYAAQLLETYEREHSLSDEIAEGDFAPLLTWLRSHVHRAGRWRSAEATIEHITGKGLDSAAFFRHIGATKPEPSPSR